MARINWKQRFAALLANPRLQGRDRVFVESLHAHYSKGKGMTTGRRQWFLKIEEGCSREVMTDDAMIALVEKIMTRTEASSWDRGFCESVMGQLVNGHRLSDKQVQTFDKIAERHSDNALQVVAAWRSEWNEGKAERFAIMNEYYGKSGYYSNIVNKTRNGDYIPTEREYNAVTGNKYAQKILAATFDAPAYSVGSFVKLRANASYGLRAVAGQSGTFMVVKVNAEPVTSAAKGAKKYLLLPIGSAKTIIAEEREIKKARKIKIGQKVSG